MKPGVLGGYTTVRRANLAVIPKADLYVLISVGTCWDVLSYVSDGGIAPPELSYLKVTQSLLEKVVAISGVTPVTFGHPHRSDILKRRRYCWNAGLLSSRQRKAPGGQTKGRFGKGRWRVLCLPARPAYKPRGEKHFDGLRSDPNRNIVPIGPRADCSTNGNIAQHWVSIQVHVSR